VRISLLRPKRSEQAKERYGDSCKYWNMNTIKLTGRPRATDDRYSSA
jgi:hypothetical protein